MLLLTLFAFVAGVGTTFTPCVLPVLPVVLAGGASGGRRRPLGIALGLALSFAFAVVALTSLIDAIGLPDDTARIVAIAVLAGFGLTFLVPGAADRIEALASRFAAAPRLRGGEGFGSGLVLGGGLGLVYFPCAGPILATVSAAGATQNPSFDHALVGFSYGLGTAAALLAIMLTGRWLIERVRPRQGLVQPVLGTIMVAFAIALAFDLDIRFQEQVARNLPEQIFNPTAALERSSAIQDDLDGIRGLETRRQAEPPAEPVSARGRPSALPVLDGEVPEFTGTQQWFNTGGEGLSMRELAASGEVVLIDFWTYTCINCIRTLPYLTAWDRKYGDRGLTIVGVHSPEFAFERDAGNVADSIRSNGIEYPVVQDNNLSTWDAWQNQFWPAKYLVDAEGRLRYTHFGEGEYAGTERAIRSLLAEAGERKLGGDVDVRGAETAQAGTTPETYLGYARAQGFVNGPLPQGDARFGSIGDRVIDRLPPNAFAYQGRWSIDHESARAVRNARLDAHFQAQKVFLVLGSERGPAAVRVRLDGEPIPARFAGDDAAGGVVTVRGQRLYRLVDLPRLERHVLTLEFDPGVSGYAFTFG